VPVERKYLISTPKLSMRAVRVDLFSADVHGSGFGRH
jgi:hypothetical protein